VRLQRDRDVLRVLLGEVAATVPVARAAPKVTYMFFEDESERA
jgi:hypothetical protein